ncbi:MAG: MBL fold metallo-hydrolase [Lentihominibacter sp.]|jgi:hydroxyacylglutathione hydrolase
MRIQNIPMGYIGTNTYLAHEEETMKGFMVDPGDYSSKVSEKIREAGISIEYIILTHGHADHIMGATRFKQDFPGSKIVAHRAEKRMISNKNFNMTPQFGYPVEFDADIYVEDEDELTVGGLTLKFLFTPGHSPGGMCIYIESENVLFSGDTLFRQSIGRTDFPGCSFNTLAESIHKKLWTLPDETKVFPGHMEPTNIGFEKANNPFV